MCIIVSFKACGEVARELKSVPFAFRILVLWSSRLIDQINHLNSHDSCTFCTGVRRQDGDVVRLSLS